MLQRSSILMGIVLTASVGMLAQAPRNRTLVINGAAVSGQSYMGVGLGEIDSERARQLKMKDEYGVEVTRVEDDSPASKAGLKSGDVVLEYNGQRVEGMEQFARFVRETPPGRDAKLTVWREGNRQMLTVKIAQRKGAGAWSMSAPMAPMAPVPPNAPGESPQQFMIWASPRMGIDAEAIDGQLGQFFGVKEGVLIRAVSKGSAAEKAGLRAGDVITKVDGSVVTSPSDVTRAVRSNRARKMLPVSLMRDKHEVNVTLTIEDEDRSQQRFFDFHDGDPGAELEPPAGTLRLEVPANNYRLRSLPMEDHERFQRRFID